MRVTIGKEFTFDAAHWLPNVPEGHKCGRMHGHTYTVIVSVRGEVDEHTGWVMDFGDIKAAWKPIEEQLDHTTLNDMKDLQNPTAELLAAWLWRAFSWRLKAQPASPNFLRFPFDPITDLSITVYETPTSWATIGGA